jgi:MFS family permease
MDARLATSHSDAGWDARYEWKAVSLLAIGFGMVGLDRFIINPLFPVIQKDLGLNYRDLGLISAVLALTWGLASIFSGRLSDRVGRKTVLVPAIAIFSLLVAITGLATGLVSLLVIRSLMGLAEGAFVPASIVATVEASKPTRVGLNVGIQQMAMPLVGLGIGPVVAVVMLKIVPSWHWVFGAAALPGLVVAVLLARMLRDAPAQTSDVVRPAPEWAEVLRLRPVIVNTCTMVCCLTCAITMSVFMPNYLTDHLKLGLDSMGMVLAGTGLGAFLGMVIVPALSDRFGRRRIVIAALVIEGIVLLLLPDIGANPTQLFAAFFASSFMISGVIAIVVGPLTSGSVPANVATTATGIVVGLGEILGGALAPAVAGAIAHGVGISVIPTVALVATLVALFVVTLGVREPAVPR